MANELVVASEAKRNSMTAGQVTGVAQIIANSRMFADAREAARAAVKVLAGSEMGVGPVNSMMGIYFQREKLSFSANFMASVIQNSDKPGNAHRFRYKVKKLDRKECVLVFEKRDDQGKWEELGPSSFDMEDAKLAKLSGDNWTKYPRNMLFARALSNGAKFYCPAIFSGTPYTPDELDESARIDAEGNWTIPESVTTTLVPDMPATPEARLTEIEQLVFQTESDVTRMCAHFGVTALAELDDDSQRTAILMLRSKLPLNVEPAPVRVSAK